MARVREMRRDRWKERGGNFIARICYEEAKNKARKRKRKVDCMAMDESMYTLAASHIRKRAYLTF